MAQVFALNENAKAELEIDQLLHELYEEESKLKVVKERIQQLKDAVYAQAQFNDKKTAKIVGQYYVAKVSKKVMRKFDQNKLQEVLDTLPQLKSFFKVEYLPKSNIDIENFIKYTNDATVKPLLWASEVKEYAPTIIIERVNDEQN